jgi:threonine aldolase
LIEIENTHNLGGGHFYALSEIDRIGEGAHSHGLPVHMDGARVFHASVATGVPVDRIAKNVDTVMFCLSKGLGAPVGSMLVGSRKLIDKGRLYRKRLGGGMRQAGILAAAGIYGLENHVAGLKADHENAALVAASLLSIPGMKLQGPASGTNIVMLDTSGTGWEAATWATKAKEKGVILTAMGKYLLRAVTHYDVSRADCESAVERIQGIWKVQ